MIVTIFYRSLHRENQRLNYGVVVFGLGVKTELNIPFAPYSKDLLISMVRIPFNSEIEEGIKNILRRKNNKN